MGTSPYLHSPRESEVEERVGQGVELGSTVCNLIPKFAIQGLGVLERH